MCEIVKIHEKNYYWNSGKSKMKKFLEVYMMINCYIIRCKTAFDNREKAPTRRYGTKNEELKK